MRIVERGFIKKFVGIENGDVREVIDAQVTPTGEFQNVGR